MDKIFRKRTARKQKQAKQAIPPLPALPPSLNVDIRNSLILPGMSERFSLLLPSLSTANEVSVRNLLEQQRARGQGPSLTREEEELLMEEMRFAGGQHQYATSPLARSPNGAPSQRTASAISDWDGNPPPMEGDWSSVRRQAESSMRGSSSRSRLGGSSDGGTMSPGISPSNSGNFVQGNYASLDEFVQERNRMQGRSYGFSGKASFRDNNYLLKVQKNQSKTALDDYHDGLSSPSNSLRPPLEESDGTSLGSRMSSRRPSNGSHRTLTPQPPQPSLPSPAASLTQTREHTSPKEETEEVMLAEEGDGEGEDEAFMSPLTRAASTIRRNPSVQSQGRKRQSMLIGMSPAQAKRISVALLEIESHIRRSTLIEVHDGHPFGYEEEDDKDDREEMLEGDGSVEETLDQERERRPSLTSASSASSSFPYNASVSSHAPSLSGNDMAGSPSQTRELGSPQRDVSPLVSDHNPTALRQSPHSHASNPSYSSTLSAPRGHQPSLSVSSTAYSEDSDVTQSPRQPTLVPTRPQPARYTPSPAFGMSGYVPGQPRPVGSVRQASISSRRTESIGSPTSVYASPHAADDPPASKVPFPHYAGSRPQQSRSISQPLGSTSTSRSQTPTQGRIDHVPAPGVLASRHQQSSSFGETFGWRSGSALALYSPTRVAEEERSGPSTVGAFSPVPHNFAPQPSDRPSPTFGNNLLPIDNTRRAGSIASCVSTYTPPSDDSSPWAAILNEREAYPLPGDEQDRADLDLLKSMSGMGKEELSLIQGALVEKAKNERDDLRSEQTSATPSTQSAVFARSPSQPSIVPTSPALTDKSGALSPSSSVRDIAAGRVPGISPQHVSREQLPQGSPADRGTPQDPSDKVKESTPEPQPAATTGHDRSGSGGRKWIDDDPEAKRDIEKRIATATSELFRAPSRGAHKRSLSKSAKKAISTPTLVSYSATVPTVPIAQGEKEKKKGGLGPKLSLRWKKKKRSLSGTPDLPTPAAASAPTPPSTAPASTPTPVSKSATSPTLGTSDANLSPTLGTHEFDTPQQSPKPNGSQTAPLSVPQQYESAEEPAQSAPPAPRAPTSDLNGFRFPRAPSVETNGAATPVATERHRTLSQVVELSRKTHRSTGSEDTVAINRFFEAGRAIGLGEDQLNDMIRQNSRTSTVRSYHSTAPTTTSFSHSQSASQSHSRSLSQALQSAAPTSPTHGQHVLHPGQPMARVPSPIAESSHHQPDSDAAVVRRTIVVANEEPEVSRPFTPTSPTLPPDRSPKRANSIRRKPIHLNSADRELVARSPKSAHSRNFSGQSGISESFDLPPRRIQDDDVQTPPHSATSSGGMLNSSTRGSIYDYYNRDSPRDSRGSVAGGERASQAVEITEYADGRVVWNILNAMRDEPHPRGSEYSHGHRESLSESLASEDDSRSSAYGAQPKDSDIPWRLGPTPGLSFMRRPETRVYYTSSADVSDLIDQLSADVTGAARGRIDIRPHAYQDTNDTEDLHTPSAARAHDFDPAQFADAPSPFHHPRSPQVKTSPEAHARYAAGMGGLSPQDAYTHGSGLGGGVGASDVDSPSAASFGSDVSGANERSVEERLQALMDRLKAAPGGVGRD